MYPPESVFGYYQGSTSLYIVGLLAGAAVTFANGGEMGHSTGGGAATAADGVAGGKPFENGYVVYTAGNEGARRYQVASAKMVGDMDLYGAKTLKPQSAATANAEARFSRTGGLPMSNANLTARSFTDNFSAAPEGVSSATLNNRGGRPVYRVDSKR